MLLLVVIVALNAFDASSDYSHDIERRCEIGHRVILSGYTFDDNCNHCHCTDGVLICRDGLGPDCLYKPAIEVTPRPPNSCQTGTKTRLNGQVFKAEDGCNECWCEFSEIFCTANKRC